MTDAGDDQEQDAPAAEQPRAEVAPPPSAEPPRKRTPAEAFGEMTETLHHVASRVDEIDSFVRAVKKKLFHDAKLIQAQGLRAGLDVLFRLHDLTYRHIQGSEAAADNDAAEADLARVWRTELESGLEDLGVVPFTPATGKRADYSRVKAIGTEPAKGFGGKGRGKVASVHACGFEMIGEPRQVIRKAHVTVYQSEEATDGGEESAT